MSKPNESLLVAPDKRPPETRYEAFRGLANSIGYLLRTFYADWKYPIALGCAAWYWVEFIKHLGV